MCACVCKASFKGLLFGKQKDGTKKRKSQGFVISPLLNKCLNRSRSYKHTHTHRQTHAFVQTLTLTRQHLQCTHTLTYTLSLALLSLSHTHTLTLNLGKLCIVWKRILWRRLSSSLKVMFRGNILALSKTITLSTNLLVSLSVCLLILFDINQGGLHCCLSTKDI